jgi:hypothetical protein
MAEKALKINTTTGDYEQTADLVESSEVSATPGVNVIPRGDSAGKLDADWLANKSVVLGKLAQSGASDGQIATYNALTGEWEPQSISGSTVTVRDQDGTPSISASTIEFPNGSVTDQGGGVARVSTGGGSGLSISEDTYANLPVGAEGDLHFSTDAPYLLRKGASAWTAFGPIQQVTVPPSSGWSWDNQDGSSVDATAGELQFSSPQTGSSAELSVYYRSAPSTPYTITALIALAPCIGSGGYPGFGLCFGDSGGKWVHFAFQPTRGRVLWNEYTNATTYSDTPLILSGLQAEPWPPVWVRIQDTGIHRISSISTTGRQWQTLRTVTRTDFLTATRVGIACQRSTSAEPLPYALLSWEES